MDSLKTLTEEGKFIQFYYKDYPYITIDSEKKNHREIVAGVLRCIGIHFDFEKSRDPRVEDLEVPAREGENYKLVGAGYVDLSEGGYSFSGKSIDYDLRPNQEHFDEVKKINPEFKFNIKER